MDAYEIRLELLKLAQTIESERIWSERQRLEQDWHAHNEIAKQKDWNIRSFPTLPSVSHSDIIKAAEELNKFVSNKS